MRPLAASTMIGAHLALLGGSSRATRARRRRAIHSEHATAGEALRDGGLVAADVGKGGQRSGEDQCAAKVPEQLHAPSVPRSQGFTGRRASMRSVTSLVCRVSSAAARSGVNLKGHDPRVGPCRKTVRPTHPGERS